MCAGAAKNDYLNSSKSSQEIHEWELQAPVLKVEKHCQVQVKVQHHHHLLSARLPISWSQSLLASNLGAWLKCRIRKSDAFLENLCGLFGHSRRHSCWFIRLIWKIRKLSFIFSCGLINDVQVIIRVEAGHQRRISHLVASCLSQTSKLTRSVSVTGLTEWALQHNSCEPINTYRMCLLSSPSSWWWRTSWKSTHHVQVQSNEDGYFSEIRLVGQEQQGEQAIACAKPWLSPLAHRCAEAASHWSSRVGTSHVDSGATCNFFSLLASSNKGLILKMSQNAWWCQASWQRFWPMHRLWCSPCMSLPYSTTEKRNNPWCIPYCWELHKLVEEKHQVVELVVQAEWQRLSSLHSCLLIQQVTEPMIPSQLASWVGCPIGEELVHIGGRQDRGVVMDNKSRFGLLGQPFFSNCFDDILRAFWQHLSQPVRFDNMNRPELSGKVYKQDENLNLICWSGTCHSLESALTVSHALHQGWVVALGTSPELLLCCRRRSQAIASKISSNFDLPLGKSSIAKQVNEVVVRGVSCCTVIVLQFGMPSLSIFFRDTIPMLRSFKYRRVIAVRQINIKSSGTGGSTSSAGRAWRRCVHFTSHSARLGCSTKSGEVKAWTWCWGASWFFQCRTIDSTIRTG